jgi:hypothetical protein
LKKLPEVRKFTVIIPPFIYVVTPENPVPFSDRVNQCVRNPVREIVLYNGRNSIAKTVSCRVTSVKQCAAAPTVLLLYTQGRSQ